MKKLLVVLAAVAFVVAFTAPAMSADWSFYGSSRMSTFFDSDDKVASGLGFDDDDLTWSLQGNSRFGAKVKAGDINGRIEYGTGVNLRLLYATWNFGGGELLVGQDYSPMCYFPSNQVYGGDTDLLPYGGIYNGRRPMIQLKTGGFKIALIQPFTSAVTGFAAADTDTSIPKIEASYGFGAGPLKLALMGQWNTFDVVDAANNEEGVDTYALGLGFKIPFGAVSVGGNVWMGQNTGNTGMWTSGDNDAAWNGTQIVDNDALGYVLVVGFKASDALKFEVGYGQQAHELDVAGSQKDETSSYYAQAVVTVAKGFFIVPEIGKVDYQEDGAGNDQGDTTYFGAKWQINF